MISLIKKIPASEVFKICVGELSSYILSIFFTGAAFVLHNIVIFLRKDPPVLLPYIQEKAFE